MCAGQKAKRMCAQSTLSASRQPSNLPPPPFPIPLSPLCCIHSRACMLCPCTVHKHAGSEGDAASRRRRQRSARERERAHVTSLYIKWRCIWAADVCSCVRVHLRERVHKCVYVCSVRNGSHCCCCLSCCLGCQCCLCFSYTSNANANALNAYRVEAQC